MGVNVLKQKHVYKLENNFEEKACLWAKRNSSETILELFLAKAQSMGGGGAGVAGNTILQNLDILRKSKVNHTNHKGKDAE